jgi:hypothetical protein
MKEVKVLPDGIVKEGQKVYRHYEYNFAQGMSGYIVIITIAPIWTWPFAFFLVWLWLFRRQGAKLLRTYSPKYWNILALRCVVTGLLAVVARILFFDGVALKTNMTLLEIIVLAVMGLTAAIACGHFGGKMDKQIELNFYKSKGYIYTGKLGDEL